MCRPGSGSESSPSSRPRSTTRQSAPAVENRGFLAVHVGLRRESVGHDPAREAREQAAHAGVVETGDRRAVERHAVGEGDERLLHGLDRAVGVEVLRLDVGDHGEHRGEGEERAVELVGLAHQVLGVAETGVGAEEVHPPAHHHGGVEPGPGEHEAGQRGRRGLAVRAGDGDRPLQARDLAEHLGPPDDRNAAAARRLDLGVRAGHRRGDHQDLHARQVVGCVTERPPGCRGSRDARWSRWRRGRTRRPRAPRRGAARRDRTCRRRRCRRSGGGGRARSSLATSAAFGASGLEDQARDLVVAASGRASRAAARPRSTSRARGGEQLGEERRGASGGRLALLEHLGGAGGGKARALASWWPSAAAANGTSSAARRAAASSETVRAPARATTRAAPGEGLGRTLQEGDDLGRHAGGGVALPHLGLPALAGLVDDSRERRFRDEPGERLRQERVEERRALAAADHQHA